MRSQVSHSLSKIFASRHALWRTQIRYRQNRVTRSSSRVSQQVQRESCCSHNYSEKKALFTADCQVQQNPPRKEMDTSLRPRRCDWLRDVLNDSCIQSLSENTSGMLSVGICFVVPSKGIVLLLGQLSLALPSSGRIPRKCRNRHKLCPLGSRYQKDRVESLRSSRLTTWDASGKILIFRGSQSSMLQVIER